MNKQEVIRKIIGRISPNKVQKISFQKYWWDKPFIEAEIIDKEKGQLIFITSENIYNADLLPDEVLLEILNKWDTICNKK
jgi:hypothetical protein